MNAEKSLAYELGRLGLLVSGWKCESTPWDGIVTVEHAGQIVHVNESDALADLEPYGPDNITELIAWGIMEANEAGCPEEIDD